jgi:hypothetical protein
MTDRQEAARERLLGEGRLMGGGRGKQTLISLPCRPFERLFSLALAHHFPPKLFVILK